MSNNTLHPASANFLMEISDECESPGIMCSLVNASGSQGISILHVWVDWMLFSSGSVILSGDDVGLLLTTGAPCNRKCPVAPESEMTYCTAPCNLVGCKIGVAFGSSCRLCASPLLYTVVGYHEVLVAAAGADRESACVVCVESADGFCP